MAKKHVGDLFTTTKTPIFKDTGGFGEVLGVIVFWGIVIFAVASCVG